MNDARGEFEVHLGEAIYTLVPSFAAIQAIESRFDGLMSAARTIELNMNMTAAATVIWAGVSEGGAKKGAPTLTEIGDQAVGRANDAIPAAQRFILACLDGVFDRAEDEEESEAADDPKSD